VTEEKKHPASVRLEFANLLKATKLAKTTLRKNVVVVGTVTISSGDGRLIALVVVRRRLGLAAA
jgi:hypothetical protein